MDSGLNALEVFTLDEARSAKRFVCNANLVNILSASEQRVNLYTPRSFVWSLTLFINWSRICKDSELRYDELLSIMDKLFCCEVYHAQLIYFVLMRFRQCPSNFQYQL